MKFRNYLTVFPLAFAILFSNGFAQESKDQPPKNLVENPSFESLDGENPAGWATRTWSGDPTFATENAFGHTGKRCVKIHSDAGANASWSFQLKVKPNTDYRLSAWIKTEKLEDSGQGALINLHELQFEGKSESVKGTSDWKKVTSEFHSGPRNSILVNCLFGGWGRATGTAWFDDIVITEVKNEIKIPKMTHTEAVVFFEEKVLPVFEKNCFQCHGGGNKVKAELIMTNREDFLKGGESGLAIDLESPMDSLLLEAINYEGYEMPPSGKLSQSDIDNITTWILVGAPWNGEGFKPVLDTESHSVPQVNAETKQWWAYQPPKPITPPSIQSNWVSNEIDQFVLDSLQKANLTPNDQASKQTLIRRAYYDLTGLPPSIEQVDAFLNDDSANAFEKVVDQLLDSKHYGEKWARHWLDLVRYAESNSYERDGTKPFVWRYRDYVIDAFNKDKPYDQFIIEQLAGDELENQTAESLIATGYYRLGKWDDEPVDRLQAWYDDMDDVVKTTGQTFLGMTIDCARCHDHKIDPIPQADYYKMLAFFRNVQRYGVRGHDTVLRQSSRPIASKEIQQEHRQAVEAHQKSIRDNDEARKKIVEWVKKDFIDVEHEEFRHEMNRVPLVKKRVGKKIDGKEFTADDASQFEELFNTMRQLRREKPKALEACLCVTEKGSNAPVTHILIRGNAHAESEEVQPGFPSVLSPPEPRITTPSDNESTGRRLALANWIASPENPLTARIMVNRVWQHHFGRGIVRSSSDFGFQGAKPTHPELLDWLARNFSSNGWKLKRLHKLIMMSSTYQMSSANNDYAYEADPLNDLLWRFDMRRLTAEEVRDSILSVNGSINLDKMFGPSIYPIIPPEVLHGQSRPGDNWGRSSEEDLTRRSIYIHIKRSLPVPLMASFDVADPDSSCPVRFNTVQPTQALGMLNSKFLNDQAAKFAQNILARDLKTIDEKIDAILERVFQRKPTEQEVQLGLDFMQQMKNYGHDDNKALELYCVVALNLNEFLYLD